MKRLLTLLAILLVGMCSHQARAQSPSPAPAAPSPAPSASPAAAPSPAASPSAAPAVPPALKALKLPVGGTEYYAIKWLGVPVGYSQFQVQPQIQLGGEGFYVINSSSRIKIGIGEVVDSGFQSKLILSSVGLKPSYYRCQQRFNKTLTGVEVLFSQNLIAQKNITQHSGTEFAYGIETMPWLLFNNLWGTTDTFVEHYLVLALVAQATHEAAAAYDPILQGGDKVSLDNPRKSTYKLPDGTTARCQIYTMSDLQGRPAMTVGLQEGQSRLLWLQQVGGGLRYDLCTREEKEKLDRVTGLDLYKDLVVPSKIFFPDATQLRSLKATLKARVRNPDFLDHQAAGFTQEFAGSALADGQVDGTIAVRTSDVTIVGALEYPYKTEDLAPIKDAAYLKNQLGIESDDPLVKNKALEVTWKTSGAWNAARRVNQWVYHNIKAGYGLPSARQALSVGEANAAGKAMLSVALLRAVGIPARVIGGLLFSQGNFVPHYWVEVWLGKEGWAAMDPSTGEAGTLGATHIALGELGSELVSASELDVSEYSPRPDRRVAYFNRELTWPVGEEKVFVIRRGAQVVGRETAVLQLNEQGEDDVYELKSQVSLENGGHKLSGHESLVMTPEGLPIRSSYEGNLSPGIVKQNVVFGKGAITTEVQGARTVTREIPYSKGVYLADRRFYTQLALMVGQAPNLKMGKKITTFVFMPDTLTLTKMELDVKGEDVIVRGGDSYETWRCEGPEGLIVLVNKDNNQVVRISNPAGGLEIELESSRLKL